MAQVTPQFEVENSRLVYNMLYFLLNIVVLKLFTAQQWYSIISQSFN
jgi:hypothetical protein